MIDGITLKNAIISGANNLFNSKRYVNELNIFPVPDGDTGTNMSLTIGTAVEALEKIGDEITVSEVVKTAIPALLRGARGNSGVILSLLFRGFSKLFEGKTEINGKDLVEALEFGVNAAYEAVTKPTEGTMLTVGRVAFEKGLLALENSEDEVYAWSEVCKGSEESLKMTPDLLPVLKKAGVVDAGGKGLCLIFEGMLSVFRDNVIIRHTEKTADIDSDDIFRNAAAEFDGDINFTYCTEYIVKRDKLVKETPKKLRTSLEKLGDCVVVVDDEEIIKVHVHTENPGKTLEEGIKYGQFLNVKIENMKEQHLQAVEAQKEKLAKEKPSLEFKKPSEEVGFVAVAAGNGIANLFKDLGCAHVINGGQTMNPSTDDISEAILATPAKTVFVFPNNKNIIMSAQQSAEIIKDRKVIIVPTKTVAQGISSLIAFDFDLSAEENLEIMTNVGNQVKTGQITFAARNSEFGGFKIKENDILALVDGKLILTDKDPIKAALNLVKKTITKENEFVTLIYGEKISLEQAEKAKKLIESAIKHEIEINLINGEQPVYHFIISIE